MLSFAPNPNVTQRLNYAGLAIATLCYGTVLIRAIMFDICIQPNRTKSHWITESDETCPGTLSCLNWVIRFMCKTRIQQIDIYKV